mgnify:CR=1 FL=1
MAHPLICKIALVVNVVVFFYAAYILGFIGGLVSPVAVPIAVGFLLVIGIAILLSLVKQFCIPSVAIGLGALIALLGSLAGLPIVGVVAAIVIIAAAVIK